MISEQARMTMKNENRIIPFSTLPHYIRNNYLDKKLQRNEWILLVWLRSIADPYGIVNANTTALRDDMFPSVEVNTVVKLLRSLRSKKYIYYENHQGHRGSFRIKVDEWLLKDKGFRSIAHLFTQKQGEDEPQMSEPANTEQSSEPSHTLEVPTHTLDETKSRLVEGFSMNPWRRELTSPYNEHDTEQKKENDDTLGNYEGRTPVSAFEPRTYEEQRCAEIAKEVGEHSINPLLGVLRKDGLRIIERAWGLYREDKENGKHIDKPAAYFYGIIKKLKNGQ